MTPISFGRPAPAVRDLLRELLDDPAVTVSTKPIPGGTGDRPTPWIQVRVDGRFRDARLNGTATVRLVVWHPDGGLAEELAERCEALLLDSHSPAFRGFGAGSGPLVTHDEEAELPLAFVTLTARLRPTNLT